MERELATCMRAKRHVYAYLRRTEDENGPAGLDDGVTAAGSSLNLLDLAKSPVHAGSEVLVDVLEVLDDANLVTVAGEESCDFLVVHRTVDCTLRDLEAVHMNDWQDRAGLGGIDVLVAVPCTECKPSTYALSPQMQRVLTLLWGQSRPHRHQRRRRQ